MPVTLLLWLALGGFFAAAALGAAMLTAHARSRRVPVAPAFVHGFFAAGGLILLIAAVITGGAGGGIGPWPRIALAVFLGAAALGATLLYLHVRTGTIPIPLGVAHAALAAAGIVTLFLVMAFRAYSGAPAPLNPAESSTPAGPTAPAPQVP